ncbi:hypothetical protein T01_1695 [Trichinella spiralis]|uniref:Uncharacterized protein n=1 Tax=Trichinella spiralis TaxID=6334 RepID=A0A0V0YUY5_TRISP|nr:hypothetical protein T01_4122 [Trichinella spiralis]KRY25489.1 hypothetical protein T01_2556 [Trichinella spiralis]KRY25491.1 hypothetical protein T01_9030 [Trichinella spiralis]KRY25496.1 hypothetical protein T01_1695 [Trichinella spiralis]
MTRTQISTTEKNIDNLHLWQYFAEPLDALTEPHFRNAV